VAKREHVILCGFGRVGQNVARVLESHGFEYIAIDLDPVRVRTARQIGQPVVYGDSADEQVLEEVGLATANAVVISFSDTRTSMAILRSLRRLRAEVPVLVRTPDDTRVRELKEAGATEVVPEAFEASLMLASHVLMSLQVPAARVMRSVQELRGNRYEMLRNVIARGDGSSNDAAFEEQVRSVVVPPGSWWKVTSWCCTARRKRSSMPRRYCWPVDAFVPSLRHGQAHATDVVVPLAGLLLAGIERRTGM
jgi:CPA2 family monovalent cation:H+ antiporter-2